MRQAPKIADITARIAGECLAVRLRRLNREVTALYDEALRPLGLKTSQLNMLVMISAAGGRAEPRVIGEYLHLEKSTVSRNLERMAARGWVEFTEHPEDGRSFHIRLTRRGGALLTKAMDPWQRAQAAAHELIGRSGANFLQPQLPIASASPG